MFCIDSNICTSDFSGNPVVDYLSLDVEGAEISVLRTIPWQRVKIRYYKQKRHQKRRFPPKKTFLIYRTASIEVAHSDTAAIVAHMVKAGFRVIRYRKSSSREKEI